MDYPFEQISFGGVQNPEYLKGHDYTYVGAQPGEVVKCLRRMRYKNGILFLDEYEKIVRKWIASITRLGAIPNGLWRVDFDTGEGYLCWRFPELKIGYFRDYDCEFDDRKSVKSLIEETAPVWA
jgi:hypothetical protein